MMEARHGAGRFAESNPFLGFSLGQGRHSAGRRAKMAKSHDPGLGSTEALKIRTAGRQARDAGQPVTARPHPDGTEANYQWVSGWTQPHATAPEDAS